MKILVADDEKNARLNLISMIYEINLANTTIIDVENGEKLFNVVHHFKPDIAFVDIQMPVMDGLSSIGSARILSPTTKWIIFSGFQEFDFAKRAIELGVVKYLLKPLSMRTLEETFIELGYIKPKIKTTCNDYVEQAIHITKNNYMYNIGLSTIADKLEISPNYLGNLFYKRTNTRYVDFLSKIRILKAKELLHNTSFSIQKISAMVGYHNPKYFSKMFFKYEHMLPTEYRDRYANG